MRVRSAVLDCIVMLTDTDEVRRIFLQCTNDVVVAISPFLGERTSLKEKAIQGLLGIARLDADGVWFAMTELASKNPHTSPSHPEPPNEQIFKPFRKLLPRSQIQTSNISSKNPLHAPTACPSECGEAALGILNRLSRIHLITT